MESNIIQQLAHLRTKAPLVQNISNFVVMNNTANALLAIGASPIMSHAKEEMPEMLQIVNSLVINIGTLDVEWAKAMIFAADCANELHKPWVLDPVGAGISKLRNETLKQLLDLRPTVIRGNASEIMALHSFEKATVKGVDSTESSNTAIDAAKSLNKTFGSIVCISGEIDYIVSDNEIIEINNGSPLMTKVTGLGCSSTAIIGAFLGLGLNPFEEAAAGVAILSLAGELAALESKGPGSLQMNLYDQLYQMDTATIEEKLKIKRYAYSS